MINLKFIPVCLFGIILLFFTACKNNNNSGKVGIRGKIVNPKKDHIIISRDFLRISSDTLFLLDGNEVKDRINIDEEGLYFIEIFPEFQTIYLRPDDSLAFHINVEEFDESLSFSGSLGFENNLLIELFLANENESEFFYQNNFHFTRLEFIRKIDSFTQIQNRILTNNENEFNKTGKKFKEIINLTRNSIHYSLAEEYLKKYPDSIFDGKFAEIHRILHRNLPDPNIIYMYAFADKYLERKIGSDPSCGNNLYYEIGKKINEELKDKDFKDNMLLKYCYKYLKDNLIYQSDSITDYYFHSFNNPSYVAYCQNIIQKNEKLHIGKRFPDIEIIDAEGIKHRLNELLEKQSLITFWDLNRRKNFISNLNKLNEIKKQFPGLRILILNINPGEFDEWLLQLPKFKNFDYYQITGSQAVNKIKPFHLSQIFLLSNDTIKLSMYNMYKPDFQDKLKELSLNP